nr:hypothetical protein [Lachnospiraceae bacterium]
MNIVLIIRPEIANIFILLFLIMYNHYCHKMHGDKLNSFAPFAIFAFVHNLFALITEITVN